MEDTMLTNKKWTNKELMLVRLKNMMQWDEEDFKFYQDINKKLLDILKESEIKPSINDNVLKKT